MFRPLIWRLGERIRFQVHSGCQQKSVPCYFRARDPISSLSVILELLSTSFLHPQSQQQSIKFCFCFIFLIFPPVISLLPPFLLDSSAAVRVTEPIFLLPVKENLNNEATWLKVCINVHCGFIQNSPKLEVIYMSQTKE